MANQLPNAAREGFLAASMGWKPGSLPATWVPYITGSVNPALWATAVFLSDIVSSVWRARGTYLTGRTTASGIGDAADTTVGGVGSAGSATAHWIVLVNETGASQTSLLGPVIDVASNLPFQPNGGNVDIVWPGDPDRIFRL